MIVWTQEVLSTHYEVVSVLSSLMFFLGLFIAIKITAIVALMNSGNDLGRSLSLIWDDQTAGLFAAIMSFWFGGRAISKYMKVKQ